MSHMSSIRVLSGPKSVDQVREALARELPGGQLVGDGTPGDYAYVSSDDEDIAWIWTYKVGEAALSRFRDLFLRLCETTDWEIGLDWDEAEIVDGKRILDSLYRPAGSGEPVVYDPESDDAPI